MKHQRIFIYPKDIQTLTNKSESQARRIFRQIKAYFKKKAHQQITFEECAIFFGVEVEKIHNSLLLFVILLKGNGL